MTENPAALSASRAVPQLPVLLTGGTAFLEGLTACLPEYHAGS